MKSPQLLRLQQQFLASLHREPTPWIVDQIIPAQGFTGAEEILKIYLHRAMARTVDPLHDVFKTVRWLIGAEAFEKILEKFYESSPGEPLNAQTLATEFACFLGCIDKSTLDSLSASYSLDITDVNFPQMLLAAGMLDWRCLWAKLAPSRNRKPVQELIQDLHHRCHIWARPRLNRGTRLCVSGVDLEALKALAGTDASKHRLPMVEGGIATFLIYSDLENQVIVRRLNHEESLLLNHCDGTHTLASLKHEGSFYNYGDMDTINLVQRLITEGVIVDLQSELK
ncbi:DNA-binding domain-containing protein [Synechococcus sp. CS-197]|uniref:HvfC/BufC N-terminal domain-containing protein n=1 Tax=Synechococcus sp. CS-197 TaxID=2847985 RepID=UPI00015255C8|nr:DNA-binding domain-containing protein [Synechococcus sp. CS-197]MCT0252158.1 putative DNA-binding domain-containing protein [Synechococcus sp. CS-197]CAK23734.1 Conserved hypothetical protein [Synechococcus sp. WH 7803]